MLTLYYQWTDHWLFTPNHAIIISVFGKSKHLCSGYKQNYKNICQPVSMNYHLSGILKESFSLSLERVSDLLMGSHCLQHLVRF